MQNSSYVTLTRQSGLIREIQLVANNIANAATSGYRQEGLIFSEFVKDVENGPSLSMAAGNTRNTSTAQGALTETGSAFDFAIEGNGFFHIETPAGERLTRAGSFSPNSYGELVTMDGFRVLDAGGAPIFIPPDALTISVSADGTLSADGRLLNQIGLVEPIDSVKLFREDGVMFRSAAGVSAATNTTILQGFLEGSNVDPINQVARLIEIQRAYEMGQSFLDAENDRIRSALKTFIK